MPHAPIESLKNLDIATPLIAWQTQHGRQHLPWQHTRDAYRVWLSEIMLQQTQVVTVLDYYPRFLARFGSVHALAAAPLEAVLALWSGLGYYSRARNLHRCAQQVVTQYGGVFPASAALLAQLPGIGRSTAGAIAAFCFSERTPILDANVRRVLTRVLAFSGDCARAAPERQLWAYAQALLPQESAHDLSHAMPRYTQGLMDLGASVCLPRNPHCLLCPLQALCAARQAGQVERYPLNTRKTGKSTRQVQAWWWVVYRRVSDGAFGLQQRPSPGIWAGLYAPVMLPREGDSDAAWDTALAAWTQQAVRVQPLAPFVHTLTHRDLQIQPVVVWLAQADAVGYGRPVEAIPVIHDGEDVNCADWYGPDAWPLLGLPAPVRRLLQAQAQALGVPKHSP